MTGGVTGTIAGGNTFVDAAARQQVAQAVSLGDYNLSRDELSLYFDVEKINGGVGNYDPVNNGYKMDVVANGDKVVYQTFQRHPYLVGNAQEAETTQINFQPQANVRKRVGYFSSSTVSPFSTGLDGVFLESRDATVKLHIYRNDLLLHESPDISGITDWSKFNVSLKSFLYLGGTGLTDYYVKDNKFQVGNEYIHAGVKDTVIMDSPAQPIRAEIESLGGEGSLTFVCGRAVTSGLISEGFGTPANFSTGKANGTVAAGAVGMNTANTSYVVFGIRKNHRTIEYFPESVEVTSDAGEQKLYEWRLLLNPTLSAPLDYVAFTNKYLDFAKGDGVITSSGGFELAAGVGAGRSNSEGAISQALRVGQTLAGIYGQIVLEFTPVSTTHNVIAAINGKVI